MRMFALWSWNSRASVILLGRLLVVLCTLSVSSLVLALELGDNFQIHGFASQAFTLTNDNEYFGHTTDGSFGYTELGINASFRPIPRLLLSAQALSRRAGEVDDGAIRLDYGFADFTALTDEDRRWGIRLGKIKNPFGLYNETRDVAFTRPSIFLPQSVYPEQIRSLLVSANGVGLYGEERTSYGNFQFKINAVKLDADNEDTELVFLQRDGDGHFDTNTSFVGQLLYDFDGERIRAGITVVDGRFNYKSGVQDPLLNGSIKISPVVLSFQYNAEDWSFTSEYQFEGIDYRDFGATQPDDSLNLEGYYFQGEYRFRPNWNVLLRYDALYLDKADRNGKRFAENTGLPAHRVFGTDWTLGLRWDINSYAMIRAEVHRVDGSVWVPLQDNPDPSRIEQRWNMFSLQATLRF